MTPAPPIRKYGLKFDGELTPLEIEFNMVRWNSDLAVGPNKYGNGLFWHFREAQTLLWPDEDHNRWSDLILKTILAERLTVIQGCRDSGKTQTLTKYVLTDYLCFPDNTLILMSSTDVRGLELRVWGNMKDLWQRAKDRHGDLISGNAIDSKHGIFTDMLDPKTGDVRDMRKGIICVPVLDSEGNETKSLEKFVGVKQKRRRLIADECFPAGTLVNTPNGFERIENIKPGDLVLSAIGYAPVMATSRKVTKQLVRIATKDGREIICTPIHQFLTNNGWKKAIDLNQSQYIVSANEVLRNLRLRNDHSKPATHSFPILSQGVLREMEKAMVDAESKAQRFNGCEDDDEESNEVGFGAEKSQRCSCGDGSRSEDSRRKRNRTDEGRVATAANVPGGSSKLWSNYWNEARKWLSDVLQIGFRHAGDKARDRSGRVQPRIADSEIPRHQENEFPIGDWVDRVEILKQKYPEPGTAGEDSEGCPVYNLQVEGHPSYSVNGFLVHNCQFLPNSYLNVLSNLDKGDFKSAFTGNPLGQKALDKVAEPECGWDSHPEPQKTTTWRNKFDGVTINLVGTDSPNFDEDRPKNYSYMMNRDDAERVEKRFGKDSVEYYSQIKGVRKSGLNARIVLTSEMCKNNRAYEDCVWSEEEITNLIGIDAGFGGDACEVEFMQFGRDAQRQPVIKLHETELITINLNDPATPEDQIAEQTKRLCEIRKVPYSNVFFEAGMRATLAISLARVLSSEVNAVNAGGLATMRPVSDDLFVDDDTSGLSRKRLKRCDEHYSKFITEMWFSVRLLVECKQAREFPKSAVKEFSEREWVWARGTRYELETKEDFKKRCGYSPNKADAVAIAVEGARRLGFQIGRFQEKRQSESEDKYWLEREAQKHRQAMKKMELSYG